MAVGSACAADMDSNVNSDINLNSEEIIVNSNGIENCNEVSMGADSQINVEDVETNHNGSTEISSTSASNVNEKVVADNGDSKSITSVGASKTVTINQVITASKNVVSYVKNNKKLPSSITVGSYSLTQAQFSYLVMYSIDRLNAGKSTSTSLTVPTYGASTTTGDKIETSASPVSYAKAILDYVKTNKILPGTVKIGTKKAQFNVYTYAFASALVSYSSNKKLPSTVLFSSSVFNGTPTPVPTATVTVAQIMAAANTVKSYVASNKALPSTVTVGSNSVSIAQFSYLEAMAVQYLNSGKSTGTTINIISVSGNSATYSINKNPAKSAYVSAAKSVGSSMSSNKAAPAYVTVSSAKADFRVYTHAFAKILVFYKSNNRLPNTCTFDSSVFKASPTPVPTTSFTVAQIMTAAASLKTYVEKNKALPSTVTVGSTKISTAQFSYLETIAVQYLNAKKSTSTKIGVINVSGNSATYSININPAQSAYVSAAKSVGSYMSSNKKAPSYVTVSSAKADYRVYTYAFAKILAFYNTNKRLPSTCTFQSSVFSSSPTPTPGDLTYKKGVNEIATETDLSKYLVLSGHCKNNSAITKLANDLTKNCKSDLEKANAIFEYVKKNIGYSYYYNSLYDATGTLTKKTANCCDHSNLIVSLCRSAGIACRYSHAKCTFNSGTNVGHVWVQIYVKDYNGQNVWIAADATSSSNTLGHINNWKLSSMTNLKQYNLLPF